MTGAGAGQGGSSRENEVLGLSDGGKVVPGEWGQRGVPIGERAHKGHSYIHLFIQEILTGHALGASHGPRLCRRAGELCRLHAPSQLWLSLAAAAQQRKCCGSQRRGPWPKRDVGDQGASQKR